MKMWRGRAGGARGECWYTAWCWTWRVMDLMVTSPQMCPANQQPYTAPSLCKRAACMWPAHANVWLKHMRVDSLLIRAFKSLPAKNDPPFHHNYLAPIWGMYPRTSCLVSNSLLFHVSMQSGHTHAASSGDVHFVAPSNRVSRQLGACMCAENSPRLDGASNFMISFTPFFERKTR